MKLKHSSSVNSIKTKKSNQHPFWRWFWLTFLVLSLFYAGYSFYAPSNNVNWINNISSIEELTKKSNKKTVVFFTGKWCSHCQIMKREVFADKEVEEILNANVTSVKIDIDDPNSMEIVNYYKVKVTPTLIVLDSQGNVFDFAVGKIDKKKFLEMLNF
ncbi:MAG: thioredoxin family protein [Salibacteraceae bacterium]